MSEAVILARSRAELDIRPIRNPGPGREDELLRMVDLEPFEPTGGASRRPKALEMSDSAIIRATGLRAEVRVARELTLRLRVEVLQEAVSVEAFRLLLQTMSKAPSMKLFGRPPARDLRYTGAMS